MTVFGDNLRKSRESACLTQEQLADKMGMLRTNYVKLETTGKVGPKILKKLISIPELKLDLLTLQAWQVCDKYPPEIIERAVQLIKEEWMLKK